VSVRVRVRVKREGEVELVEEKTYYEVEDNEEDEHAIHHQVDAYVGPVLTIEFFQSLEHSRNSLPESNDSFFGLKRIAEATFHYQRSS
jgi:hypothetical protein